MNAIIAVVIVLAFALYTGGIYSAGYASGLSHGWMDAKAKEANDER